MCKLNSQKVQVLLSPAVGLRAYLEDNNIDVNHVAEALGVSRAQVYKILRLMRCSASQQATLAKSFNIPSNILPEISDGKPGPKPGAVMRATKSTPSSGPSTDECPESMPMAA